MEGVPEVAQLGNHQMEISEGVTGPGNPITGSLASTLLCAGQREGCREKGVKGPPQRHSSWK